MRFKLHPITRTLAGLVPAGVLLAAIATPGASTADPSLGDLNSQLGAQQSRQQTLSSGIAGLSQTISSLDRQISIVRSRVAAVQSELTQDREELARTQAALVRERRLLAVLRARLGRARTLLSRQLVSGYEQDRPDLVSVVLEANGFNDLLERLTFLREAQRQQQGIIVLTRAAKAKADRAAKRLGSLEETQRQVTDAAAVRERALAGMNQLLQSKQNALAQARSVKQQELSASRAKAGALQHQISKIEAEQQAQASQSATSSSGAPAVPSGGWAIPEAIVMCESGGQNLPPNSAGASGYYQIIPSTWQSFGGTGPAAWLASKSEQDAVASRIWDGGRGASNWECAAMVGIH